jgi:hypothetical protein
LTDICVAAEREKKKLDLDDNEYSIFVVLKTKNKAAEAEEAKRINKLFLEYPDYSWNSDQERKLRADIYKLIRQTVGADKMVETANALLKLTRI